LLQFPAPLRRFLLTRNDARTREKETCVIGI
jgi:hypothetical protein